MHITCHNVVKYLIVASILPCASMASATTLNSGGNIGTAGNWDSGLPDAGDPGSIANDAVFSKVDLSAATGSSGINLTNGGGAVTVTHSAGTITATGGGATPEDFGMYVTSGTLGWNQTGGIVTVHELRPGDGVTYTLSSGTIQGVGKTGEAIHPQGSGVFNMTGGLVTGLGLIVESGSTVNLTGGSWLNQGANNSPDGFVVNDGGTLNIGGNFGMSFSNQVDATEAFGSTGTINIATDWSGAFTGANFTTAANWQDVLDNGNVYVGDTLITSGNFNSYFTYAVDGLTLLVPEPSALVVLGLGGILLIRRRRAVVKQA